MAEGGILRLIVKNRISKKEKNKAANCDQKRVIKGPIFLEQIPPKKSDIPHPNIPPNPDSILMMIELIGHWHTLKVLLRQPVIRAIEHGFERIKGSLKIQAGF